MVGKEVWAWPWEGVSTTGKSRCSWPRRGCSARPADHADTETLVDSVMQSQQNLEQAGSEVKIEEVAADKGYHAARTLELSQSLGLRMYIPEPRRPHPSRWTDKPPALQHAVLANRRRVRRGKSKRLQRLRSERCERSFAHVCDSGGMRRSWLKGLTNLAKRYLIAAAAHNLGRILRKLFGVGKPKAGGGLRSLLDLVQLAIAAACALLWATVAQPRPCTPTLNRTPTS